MRFAALILGLAVVMLPSAAPAQDRGRPEAPPPVVQQLLACRAIADPAQRLSCFDKESQSVDRALASRDIVAIDREQVRETRRSFFGLRVPTFGVFGGDDADQVNQIESTVAGVGHNRDGGYIFRLADGSRWTQTDGKPIALEPRAGDKVTVKRGVMGSFLLRVGTQAGVKVERIN